MINRDTVLLVDINDKPLAEVDKLKAHQMGLLHRAFSVFIVNSKGEMLIHQRAKNKYHGAGLWTNACCSHPQLNEDIKESALERLDYEMGLSCEIKETFTFVYKIPVENNLIEHEYDHVFLGKTDEDPKINLEEAQDFKWINIEGLLNDIETNPKKYTSWFKMAIKKFDFRPETSKSTIKN